MNHVMPRFDILCLLLLAKILGVSSYSHFWSLIPNGQSVLDPCNNQSKWEGVGHQTREGSTARNPFGLDFRAQGNTWSPELCRMDSDGDGRRNGEELGDPHCVWTPGKTPSGPALSHPGVCEPLSNMMCKTKNSWLDCSTTSKMDQLMCASIASNTTYYKELRLAPTAVPSTETTYFCQMFELNVHSDQHMIATQPLINQSDVVHHILLFGCDPRVHIEPELQAPYPCVMVPHDGCRSLIGAWTVGSRGECAHPDMGFKVGPRGYKTVAIQIHWNNPRHIEGLIDSSGMRIHLTSSLRKNDAGMLVIGQQYLQIEPRSPPGSGPSPDMKFSASCPERCTKVMFKSAIFVTSAVNHMHYLGKSQEIKVYQNNSVTHVITDQHNYDYDDPIIHTFSEPIKINPGDEIRTTCVFKRPSSQSEPVCWGKATSEEMCFGFITYYPLQSLSHPWCTSMESFPSCDRHLPALSRVPVGGCRWWEFRNSTHSETRGIMGRVFDKCYPNKQENLTCTEECQEACKTVADHPCLQGDTGRYMVDKFKEYGPTGQQFLDAVITCSCRSFSYCDRKTSQRLLGSQQAAFCTSAASSWSTHFLFFLAAIILLL